MATSVPACQQQLGRVCDEVNDNDEARARDAKAVKRSAHALTSFGAIEAPRSLATTRRQTEAAWSRYLARLRDFRLALDRSSTRAQRVAALQRLAADRPALAGDADGLRTGLQRLGAADCDLEPQIVVRKFTLPPPAEKRTAEAREASGGGD